MSASLSIGIVCYPGFGGSGVIAAELAAGMAHRGHRVHVIASAPPSRPLPASAAIAFHAIAAADYPLLEHPEYALAAASVIADVGRQLDLVHVHYAVPHATSAHLARQVLGARAPALVTTLHGTDVTHVGAHPSYHAVTQLALAASDAVTVPSKFLRHDAVRRFGLDEAAIEVIPNFVDSARFAPPPRRDRRVLGPLFPASAEPEAPVLFHVSNFRRVKRPVELIEVLARVRQRAPARLILVGDGPERARVAERAAALGIAASVCFLGPRGDFGAQLGHADAFLLTSETESFGLAALEALSAGVPVFGYRTGGLPEVVADGSGCLVAPGDIEALAEAVHAGMHDVARQRMGAAARAQALRFRPDAALDRYESLYRRVLEQRA